jgi:single-strand DNA-binding protein
MKAFGVARIGRDVELRYTAQGEAVASLSLAFSYGRKGHDNKQPTQWVDAALWGKRAEALAPYLAKGHQIGVTLEDVHIETYTGKNGEGHKLVARVLDVQLIGNQAAASAATARPAPAAKAVQPALAGSGFDDMDDDIPF